jgi:hypothetical protein
MRSGRKKMALKAVLEQTDYDLLPEAVKAEYKEVGGKFHLDVTDMKPITEFNTVHGALTKERLDHKKAKDKLALFGTQTPEEIAAQLARIPELEILAEGKVDDKKIEELVTTRIHAKVAPVERERDQLKVKLTEKDSVIEGFQVKEKTRAIHDAVGKAVRGAKVLDTAQEDAMLLAERVFEVADDGAVVTRDNVGVTPGLAPEAWVKDMAEKRPHWWAPSQGGGARGGAGGGTSGPNPFSKDGWNLTEQGQMLRTDRPKAERMAKAAGTSIGGKRPT